MGHRVVIPDEVVLEIKRLLSDLHSRKDRDVAEFSLRVIEANDYEKISCPGRYVDKGIVNFLRDNPEYILATYDKSLKKKVSNRILVLRGKKKLEIV